MGNTQNHTLNCQQKKRLTLVSPVKGIFLGLPDPELQVNSKEW